jgi:hypothetical protein
MRFVNVCVGTYKCFFRQISILHLFGLFLSGFQPFRDHVLCDFKVKLETIALSAGAHFLAEVIFRTDTPDCSIREVECISRFVLTNKFRYVIVQSLQGVSGLQIVQMDVNVFFCIEMICYIR